VAPDPIERARAALGADPGTPGRSWLVRRLDRAGADYHLVVLGPIGATSGLAAVDLAGEVTISARLPGMVEHLTIDEATVRATVGNADSSPELVYAPSDHTRSPLYPVWRVSTPDGLHYVDLQGGEWTEW
jgi:hypothetical protein